MKTVKGFTILEIIVALTLVAILASIFVQHMSTPLIKSSEPLIRLNETFEINQVVENITSVIRERDKNNTLDLSVLNDEISNGDYNGPNGVICSAAFLDYRNRLIDPPPLIDTNGDTIYETQLSATPPTDFLLVTASKNNQSIKVLFVEDE